ncbi:MAG: alanine racemase [Pseudomonadota bacterium]
MTSTPLGDALSRLNTPTLLLDRARMRGNLQRMANHIRNLDCVLRPHVKTHKSKDVLAEVAAAGNVIGITVSTLHEAEYFFENGQKDILYAVSITPNKVEIAATLIKRGCALTVVADNIAMAELVAARAWELGVVLPILIELDVDGHRSGVDPQGEDLLPLARAIAAADGALLKGVMTHAGESYACPTLEDIKAHANLERDRTVMAADRIRADGVECPVVSIGSTPTAVMAENLDGITEIRPGVYTFFDLFQAGLGVAKVDDIALSVLTTVIGHQPAKGWVIVDAGWMAMSRDRGTEKQAVDQGYGLVCDLDGAPLGDVIVGAANQEHGVLMARDGAPALDIKAFPVGAMLRILPNHACATAGQYDIYNVIDGEQLTGEWERTNRW